MKIKFKAMGAYETNCYLVEINEKTLIIDPGVDATSWVLENAKNPVAILNTHGHFDHVWSNKELKEKLNIPIYINSKDSFMLKSDPLNKGVPRVKADYEIRGDEELSIEGIKLRFRHFPGHTPGNSVIEIKNVWFSGDFLFRGSIGRWDFPYSEPSDMIRSLKKLENIKEDFILLPGHGKKSKLSVEKGRIKFWISFIKRDIIY